MAVAVTRPDDRVLVTDRVLDERAFAPLLETALSELSGPVHLTVRGEQTARLEVARRLGRRRELSSTSFAVPFDRALASLPRRVPSNRRRIVTVDTDQRRRAPSDRSWSG